LSPVGCTDRKEAHRSGNGLETGQLLVEKIDLLRGAFEYTKQRYPFRMEAVVILPGHLHCIWTLPQADADFSIRWNMLNLTTSVDHYPR
jgi:REP element-mobilizing transposase RayT